MIIVRFHEGSHQKVIIKRIEISLKKLFGHPCTRYNYSAYSLIINSKSGSFEFNYLSNETGIAVEVNTTGVIEITTIVSKIPGFGTKMVRAVLDCLDNGTTIIIEDVNNNAAFFNKFRVEYPLLKFRIYPGYSS
jgi:hypothetical protein